MKTFVRSFAVLGGILLTPLVSYAISWTVVPGGGPPGSQADGIVEVNQDDLWAVGSFGPQAQALIEHWDGAVWTQVTSPVMDPGSQLLAVTARSSNDVWAVGQVTQGSVLATLTEHWDGTNWSLVPSPSAGTYDLLAGVSSISRADAWAVGYSIIPVTYDLMHWDGVSWNLVTAPIDIRSNLYAVKAFASNDVWAVGKQSGSALTIHWDGTAWSVIPNPVGTGALNGIDGSGPNDIWAVGSNGPINNSQPVALHWDGSAWSTVPSLVFHGSSFFRAIKVLSPTLAVAVGGTPNGDFAAIWNSLQWKTIQIPDLEGPVLFSVTSKDGTVWIAGRQGPSGATSEVFLRATRTTAN